MLVRETQVEATRSHHITAARKATANTTRSLSGDEDVEKSGPSHTLVGKLMGLENGLALPQKVKPGLPTPRRLPTRNGNICPQRLVHKLSSQQGEFRISKKSKRPTGTSPEAWVNKIQELPATSTVSCRKEPAPPGRTSKPYVREARHKRPHVV